MSEHFSIGGEGYPLAVLGSLDADVTDWVLIGAFARDIVAHSLAGLPRASETEDVDIAITVPDDAAYLTSVRRLQKQGGSRIRHRVSGFAVDVLPFGDIAPDNIFSDIGSDLDVTGLREAHASAMTVRFTAGPTIRVATLCAQTVLKLVAWGARGGSTQKDARDLALLVAASSAGPFGDALWTDDEAMAAEDYDPELGGPRRLGIDARAHFNPATVTHVTEVLRRDLQGLAHAGGTTPTDRARVEERLEALLRGLAPC